MRRRCQDGQQNPVSISSQTTPPSDDRADLVSCMQCNLFGQIENARAALDLYRSHGTEWETAIRDGHWPCALPPSTFARCYL